VQADAPAAASQAVPVSAALLVQQEVSTWQDFSGRLEAVERVELRSRVAGAIQSVHFREGALVKAGDLLVTIDPAPYQAEVDRAAAQVAAAQSQLVFARSEQERASRMLADHAIAQRDADERNNAARAADASLKAARPPCRPHG
jgi:multidrug efflux system membrane fusion protein